MTDMAPPNRPQSHDAARECRYCGDDAVGEDALGRPACKRHIEEVADDAPAATALCLALIDTRPPGAGGSDLTPCKLDDGHDGPHEPMHPDAVKMLRLQAFLGQRGIGV